MGTKNTKKPKTNSSAEKLVAKSSKKPTKKKPAPKKKSPKPAPKKTKKTLSKTIADARLDFNLSPSEPGADAPLAVILQHNDVCLRDQLNFLEGGRDQEPRFIPLDKLDCSGACQQDVAATSSTEKKSLSQKVKHFITNLF